MLLLFDFGDDHFCIGEDGDRSIPAVEEQGAVPRVIERKGMAPKQNY